MDAYLVLTPFLVFGIIGLIRFIGCNWFYGLDETTLRVDPVEDVQALAGDGRVNLSWSYSSSANATGFRIDVAGGPFNPIPPLGISDRSAEFTGLTNGIQYDFSVIAERGTDASEPVTVSATPGITSFVIDQPPIAGAARNNFSGFVGMEIMVGATPIIVTQLGRIVATTNSGIHEVKIVSPVTTPVPGQPVAGIDVVSANVTTVAQVNQVNVGRFAWAPLPQPVTLQSNTIYFIVSSEIDGGDLWHEEQPVPTTAVAALQFSIFTVATGADAGKYRRNSGGRCYVPVSFRDRAPRVALVAYGLFRMGLRRSEWIVVAYFAYLAGAAVVVL